MRFDIASFAAGLMAAFAMFVGIAVMSDYHGVGSASWCAPGETVIVCVRQWSQVVAIAGAFATVFFITHQVSSATRNHEQTVHIQTLKLRALFARVVAAYIEPMEHISIRVEAALIRDSKRLNGDFLLKQIARISELSTQAYSRLEKYDDGSVGIMLNGLMSDIQEANTDLMEADGYGGHRPSIVPSEAARLSASLVTDAATRFAHAVRNKFPVDTGIPHIADRKPTLHWLFK